MKILYLWIALAGAPTAGPYFVGGHCGAWATAINHQWIAASGIFPAVRDWDVRRAYCAAKP